MIRARRSRSLRSATLGWSARKLTRRNHRWVDSPPALRRPSSPAVKMKTLKATPRNRLPARTFTSTRKESSLRVIQSFSRANFRTTSPCRLQGWTVCGRHSKSLDMQNRWMSQSWSRLRQSIKIEKRWPWCSKSEDKKLMIPGGAQTSAFQKEMCWRTKVVWVVEHPYLLNWSIRFTRCKDCRCSSSFSRIWCHKTKKRATLCKPSPRQGWPTSTTIQ